MPCRASSFGSSTSGPDGDVQGDDRGRDLGARAGTSSAGTGRTARSPRAPTAWLHTGDIGFLDADGDLFLVDRLKELVIVSGFNVYPSEIEDVIDGGRGSAGVRRGRGPAEAPARPSSRTSSSGAGRMRAADLGKAVLAHCADRLARFKVPARVEVVERAAALGTGKVAKGRLRAGRARHERDSS